MNASWKFAYFVRTALGSMVRSPFVHVIAVASLSLALLGYSAARIARAQLEVLLDSLGTEVEFTVYLADEVPGEKVDELELALKQRTGGEVRRISPAEALGRLVEQLGDEAKGLTSLEQNPLPWSLELRLPKGARDAQLLRDLATRTRAVPFVTGVDYGEEALERLGLIARALEIASIIVFSLVFVTAVIVVSATLQLAIFARREEIEIQKLVGATDRFVRFPFLLEGMLQGVLAGAVALAGMFALVWWIEREGSLFGFVRLEGRVVVDWLRLSGEVAAIGSALGLSGSFIAVRRFLKV